MKASHGQLRRPFWATGGKATKCPATCRRGFYELMVSTYFLLSCGTLMFTTADELNSDVFVQVTVTL